MLATIAERLSEHFVRMSYARLPSATRAGVKRLLLDYLGVALAGCRSESGHVARRYVRAIGPIRTRSSASS